MRTLETIVVALMIAVSAASVASAHTCIHDTPRLRELIAADVSRGALMESEQHRRARHGFAAQAPQPVRVVISSADLQDATKYCATVGQRVSDFAGGTVTCTSEDILTAAKRTILTDNILPEAVRILSSVLKLERVSSNIVVPQGTCSGFTIPASHSSTGVANADYVLYVGAAPTSGTTLAWAGGCRSDSSGRLIVGRANFGPKYISWDNVTIQKSSVATAVHEIMHALGFSNDQFRRLGFVQTGTLRGKSVSVLTMPTLVSRFRSYIGCATAGAVPGVELEDEGSAGSAGSHFDRRVLKDEIMAASGGEVVSEMSLAAFADMGYYTPDYTAAERLVFGKNAGCNFVLEKCNTIAGGRDTWWCFTSQLEKCTVDYKSVGVCALARYDADLPSQFQYFSDPRLGGPTFLDGCPYIQGYSDRGCDEAREATANEANFGHYFGDGGRCLQTTGLIRNGYTPGDAGAYRCLQSRCTTSGLVQIKLAGNWETCSSAGQQLSGISGFKGAVICPNAAAFCTSFDATTAAEETPTPPTTAAPPGPTLSGLADRSSSEASEEVYGELVFSGTAWNRILSTRNAEVNTAVRSSIGLLFNVPSTSVTIESMSIGSLVVRYVLRSAFSASEVDARFQEAILATGSVGWYQPVTDEYQNAQPADQTRPTSHSIDERNILCRFANMDAETCYVTFIGAGVCLLLVVLAAVWCFCCRKSSTVAAEEQAKLDDIRMQRSAAGSEPYERSAALSISSGDASPKSRRGRSPRPKGAGRGRGAGGGSRSRSGGPNGRGS